jgi:hypothetical protein
MVFNNMSTISWWSVLLGEETGVFGENHRLTDQDTNPLYTAVEASMHADQYITDAVSFSILL